jgi:hypothetical protein
VICCCLCNTGCKKLCDGCLGRIPWLVLIKIVVSSMLLAPLEKRLVSIRVKGISG